MSVIPGCLDNEFMNIVDEIYLPVNINLKKYCTSVLQLHMRGNNLDAPLVTFYSHLTCESIFLHQF